MYQPGKLAVLTKECERLRVDVIGLSEVRWNGTGEFKNNKGDVLMYSGMKNDNDPHIRGVAIYVRRKLQPAIMCWKAISERIITVRFRSKGRNISVIQCYAPTEESQLEDKEIFYNMLERTLQFIPVGDCKILMGDFNAQIGNNNTGYESIMGTHALGACNENGELFLELCLNNNLRIGGSLFPHQVHHKTTWKSPGSRFETQIDHICISKGGDNILCDVRNKRSADIGSDHYLVVAELKIKLFARKFTNDKSRRAYNTQKLKSSTVKEKFAYAINNIAITNMDSTTSTDTLWNDIRGRLQNICKTHLGFASREQKEWMSADAWELIELRRSCKLSWLGETDTHQKTIYGKEYEDLSKRIKKQIKTDKRNYYEEMGKEAQTAYEKGNLKEVYRITRDLASSNFSGSSPVLDDATGEIVTSKDEQLDVWKRHFEKTLNITHNESSRLDIYRRLILDTEINTNPPEIDEICAAIGTLKSGKAAGNDGLPNECFKAAPMAMANILYPLFKLIWLSENFPADWKESIIIKIPKKGDRKNCNNWRGISLLPSVFKIFNKIVLDRISDSLNNVIRNTQAGFRPNRSCVDQINTVRILVEQAVEFNSTMYLSFVDYEKAFDALKREYIWLALSARGIPDKIITLIKSSYIDSSCRVLHEGSLSNSFKTISGVRQGCILSPLLFITVMDVIFDTVDKTNVGLLWRMDQKLSHLEYADDVVLLCDTKQDMQKLLTSLTEESMKVGLKANIGKTKAMRLNSRNTSKLKINSEEIDDVTSFEYLGSVIDLEGGTKSDVENRLKKAKGSFAMLRNIWLSNSISISTKIRIFESCVKSTLLYSCETWFVTTNITHKLQTFINRCLRYILRIWWPQTISNANLLKNTGQEPIDIEIKRRKYRWMGHTLRRNFDDISHAALEWNPQGWRNVGKPKESWRRTVFRETNKSFSQLRYIARDRTEWKNYIKTIICD